MPEFIQGLKLSSIFFHEAVKPLLARRYPHLTYSAALLGPGSDVLGYDTEQSTDHDWGPRLLLFLNEQDMESSQHTIDACFRKELPVEICGFPTNYGGHEDGTLYMVPTKTGPIRHRVEIASPTPYFRSILGFDPDNDISPVDWVSIPENLLLSLTAGRVFHDGLGQLRPLRRKLSYYPHEVWLYLLSCQWRRIGQEEAFMGRCGQVDDDLGSRIVAARLVRDLMRLCFMIERRYPPYIKWFGAAFAELESAAILRPVFENVLKAASWQARQEHLTRAYQHLALQHNNLGITPPLATEVTPFFDRPFLVIQAEKFSEAILAQIQDPQVRALPPRLGAYDQFVDSTDALQYRDRIRKVYA